MNLERSENFLDNLDRVIDTLKPDYPVLLDKGFVNKLYNYNFESIDILQEVEVLAEKELNRRLEENCQHSYIVLYNATSDQAVAYVSPSEYEGCIITFEKELAENIQYEIHDVDLAPGEFFFPSLSSILKISPPIPEQLCKAWDKVDLGQFPSTYEDACRHDLGDTLADYLAIEYVEGTEEYEGTPAERMISVVEKAIFTLESYIEALEG
jgi:hypothetical protein